MRSVNTARSWIPSVADPVEPVTHSRLVRWGALAGILVVLLLVYGLCVPYYSASLTIDRRTGDFRGDFSYFGIRIEHDRQVATPARGRPVGKGPLTAPERRIPVRTITKRFFWSEPANTVDDEGVWYAEAFYQMFYFAAWDRPKAKKLTDDELDRIVKERIPFWNSADLDRNPRGLAEAARQENADLLGVPVDLVFVP